MKSIHLVLGLFAFLLPGSPARADEFAARARAMKAELAEKILPYWFDTAQDTNHGGYLLADDAKGRGQARDKQLVSQARMVWGFSHAHSKGFSTDRRDYLKAAKQGLQFLEARFLDRETGGYFWKTDLAGKPTVDRKYLYGEAFVIYAQVEYFRASGDRTALESAMELFRVIQKRAKDPRHPGWFEHFTHDWRLITEQDDTIEVELAGMKSANAHLHLMEALAELYDTTRDAAVKAALEESLRLNTEYFYPADAAKSAFHFHPDWSPSTNPRSVGLSYGHNIEFAWLMIRAEQVLGRAPSWDHCHAHVRHALKSGFDHGRGGLYSHGVGDEPADDETKVWWVQAETIAALADGIVHRPNAAYAKALEQTIDFTWKHLVQPADGIWIDSVAADGRPRSTAKANNWKANYHDVRAMVKFIEAFGTGPAK